MNNTIRILLGLIIVASAVLVALLYLSSTVKKETTTASAVELTYEFTKLPVMTTDELYRYTVYLNAFEDNNSTYFNASFKLGASECGAIKLQNNGSNLILDCQTTDETVVNVMSPYKVIGEIKNLSKGSYSLSVQRKSVVILETEFVVK